MIGSGWCQVGADNWGTVEPGDPDHAQPPTPSARSVTHTYPLQTHHRNMPKGAQPFHSGNIDK